MQTFSNYFSHEKQKKWAKTLSSKKILIINTKWNEKIVSGLTTGAKKVLDFYGITHHVITVPGAYEIPLIAKKQFIHYDGIIALGCLIKGATFHFEAISLGVTTELSRLMIDEAKPLSFGVLMVKKQQDAWDRAGDNEANKGQECAAAMVDMLVLNDGNRS